MPLEFLRPLFSNEGLTPHIHLFLDRPELAWTVAIADSLIGVSYLAISLTLYFLARKIRPPFRLLFLAFGTFLLACGAAHFLEVYGLWVPNDWLSAGVKVVAAITAMAAAAYLLKLRPRFLDVAEAAKEINKAKVKIEDFFYHRMTTPPEIHRLLRRAVYLPLALGVVMSAAAFYEADYLQSTQYWVDHSTKVIIQANGLKETADRVRNDLEGYQLIGDEKLLKSASAGYQEFEDRRSQIVGMVSDNGHQTQWLVTVQTAMNDWRNFARGISKPRPRVTKQELSFYHTNAAFFKNVIKACDGFIDNERALRSIRASRIHFFALAIFLTMTILTISFGALFVVIGRRSLLQVSGAYGRALESEKAAQEKLKQALKARDDFFSIASHELKTPLTSLKLKVQMAARGMGFDGEAESNRRFLSQLTEQVGRLGVLVDDMLDLSRFRVGMLSMQTEEFDVGPVVRMTLERMQPQFAANGIRLDFVSDDGARVKGDQIRIEQAFTNLIVNAVKYAPNKPLHVVVARNSLNVQIMIRDEGPGIAEKDRERIFHRFERAVGDGAVSGLGVGLYLTKVIVEAHHGQLKLLSQVGAGATFVIELPISHAANEVEPTVSLRRD